ncbi:hypothetical protein [Candidatus Odyssella acanthamoebae]|uniref:Uncharacterized protein n=1 Tax=Candidatus Odyssella acanthamoebae TaxID=91604 RepID=A0A077AQS6_9PROT|nr:hypothetical protein [Candidatus Paracaedibacter acanthamoebae]AIK95527.1 hypothetical protein ID47_00265 [Candidatus Paracaedibacter acanthamoebae]
MPSSSSASKESSDGEANISLSLDPLNIGASSFPIVISSDYDVGVFPPHNGNYFPQANFPGTITTSGTLPHFRSLSDGVSGRGPLSADNIYIRHSDNGHNLIPPTGFSYSLSPSKEVSWPQLSAGGATFSIGIPHVDSNLGSNLESAKEKKKINHGTTAKGGNIKEHKILKDNVSEAVLEPQRSREEVPSMTEQSPQKLKERNLLDKTLTAASAGAVFLAFGIAVSMGK